ncbi:hypothetical protein [Burkholderia ambifaria]|uniref:hypothetical protein n=1 Tax=Burkholderia ambifaria TaxID=152480 RepID=UPI00158AF8AD|nr:hypothetical protein [Burkholderia ambifaria]
MVEIYKLRKAYEVARNAGDKAAMNLIAMAISHAVSGYKELAQPVYDKYVVNN